MSNRKPTHKAFMQDRFSEVGLGFIELIRRNLSEKEARTVETERIKALCPLFNLQQNGAANAGRGEDNHNARFTTQEAAALRKEFLEAGVSMRAFHRNHLQRVGWVSARKLMLGLSYT